MALGDGWSSTNTWMDPSTSQYLPGLGVTQAGVVDPSQFAGELGYTGQALLPTTAQQQINGGAASAVDNPAFTQWFQQQGDQVGYQQQGNSLSASVFGPNGQMLTTPQTGSDVGGTNADFLSMAGLLLGVGGGAIAGLGAAGAADSAAPLASGGGAADWAGGIGSYSAGVPSVATVGDTGFSASLDAAAPAAGATADSASFLPVTGSGSGISTLTPDMASQLLGSGGGVTDLSGNLGSFTGGVPSVSNVADTGFSADLGAMSPATTAPADAGSLSDQAMNWIKNNQARAAMMGLSVFNSVRSPHLPSAAQTALNAAGPTVTSAQATIASGGTNTPVWTQQKSSIDSQINDQLKNAIEQYKQTAANNGMGGNNSAVVQQKIAQLTQSAETQRQQLYAQAMQQNVQNAVSELTGGNQTLGTIAQMQMAQSNEAQQVSAELARIVAMMGGQTSTTPGG